MVLNLTPTPKRAAKGQKDRPKGQKSAKKGPIVAELKTKNRAVLPKSKLFVYIGLSPKNFMNSTPTPK